VTTPYKYRGVPPYVDAVAAEMDDREAGAKARLLGPLASLSPLVSQAAEHLKRRTPEAVHAAERSLWHARRALKSLEIAHEAGRRILAEIDAHVVTVKGELGIPVPVADDPTPVRRRGPGRRPKPSNEVPADAQNEVETKDSEETEGTEEASETSEEDGGLN